MPSRYGVYVVPVCYKKFELMLTRRVKAYSSSCSQIVGLSPAISSQFTLEMCIPQPKSTKIPILRIQGHLMSSMLIPLKSSSPVLVIKSSMSVPICNCSWARLMSQYRQKHILYRVPIFDARVRRPS